MGLLEDETFICFDLETTGLNAKQDRIIEVAAAKFSFHTIYDSFESLINPECTIPESSIKIHHITEDMVESKPKIREILPSFLEFIQNHIVIGHGISLDIDFILVAASEFGIVAPDKIPYIDTLRMARIYGQSPINSLERLREHFNIRYEGAHRAMSDVIVNIEVFKHLVKPYKTVEELQKKLSKPIRLATMPLGKHKGRRFDEIPFEYLQWAARKDFDQDLLFSIRSEIKHRQKTRSFEQASNPFSAL